MFALLCLPVYVVFVHVSVFVQKKKREPKEPRYALSIGGGVAEEWYYERSSSLTAWTNSEDGADGDSSPVHSSMPSSSRSGNGSGSPIDIADCAVEDDDVSDTTRLLAGDGAVEGSGGGSASVNSMGTKHMKNVKSVLLEASRKRDANPLVKGLSAGSQG